MTNQDTAYHLKDIRHFYGQTKVLDIDNLEIQKGSITGLIGPNGSGKSTLLKLLAFADKPSEGQIFYDGKRALPFSSIVRSKVTLLTQKPYLLKRSVFENIIYGLKIRKDNKNLEKKVKKVLTDVGLDFKNFAHRKWHELSGGEAQRVAMAARLILKPEVLLLDEPVASVDTKSAKLIRQASLKARDCWGATLIIASHDLQWLYSISDKNISIFNGKIFSTGIENIITGPFEKQNDLLTKKLGDGQIITLKVPGQKKSTAVITQKNITIAPRENAKQNYLNQPGLNKLSGQIISTILEKKHFRIIATISIYDTLFYIRLSPDQVSRLNLYPGKKIILKFASNDVEWF